MCPECQNVYIGVRFGQCKVEEEEEEGGRTFLLIVESKNIEQFLTDLVIKSDVWPQILEKAIGTSQNAFLFFVHIFFQLLNRFKLCFLKAVLHSFMQTPEYLYFFI